MTTAEKVQPRLKIRYREEIRDSLRQVGAPLEAGEESENGGQA